MIGLVAPLLAAILFATPASTLSRTHFVRAQKLFTQERYRQALDEFTAASEKSPEELPDLYFNIGQCHRHLGQVRQARIAFEHYLALRPDAADRKQVVALLAMLGGRAPEPEGPVAPASEPAPVTPAEPPAEVAPTIAVESPAPSPAASEPVQAVRPELTQSPVPAPSHEKRHRRWPIWVGVAAGALAVGVGVGLGAYYGTAGSHAAATATPPTTAGAPMLGSTVMFDTRGH